MLNSRLTQTEIVIPMFKETLKQDFGKFVQSRKIIRTFIFLNIFSENLLTLISSNV